MKEDTDIKYHYISTKETPADIASRGASACELQHNRWWWHGPDWMTNTREAWPVWNYEDQSDEVRSQTESEFRKANILFEAKLMAGEDHSEIMSNQFINAPFNLNLQKFSSVTRLWRVPALALRFVNKLRKKTNQHGPLDANEMELAEILWTKYVQRQQYSEVVNSIRKSKSNNLQRQLGIFIDIHGILRALGNAGLRVFVRTFFPWDA